MAAVTPADEGAYRELAVASTSLAFERAAAGERMVVAVNGGGDATIVEARVGGDGLWKDALNEGATFRAAGGTLRFEVPKTWARALLPA